MVFTSIPSYLDPANWQQQPPNYQAGNTSTNAQLPPPPPPPPPPQPHGGSIRPGSMADRARLANIPMPEAPLKCPRCDSTNTKFCYFNNYSLSQPRHFCKTCRRYWTRGGALRNVPVGGGCRRNKRSKGGGGSTKSSATGSAAACSGGASSSTTGTAGSGGASGNEILGLGTQLSTPLHFMAPLHYLNEFTNSGEIGSTFGGITTTPLGDMNFHSSAGNFLGSGDGGSVGSGGVNVNSLLSGGMERWRYEHAHQLTALSGLDPQTGVYPFEGIMSSSAGPSGYSGGGACPPRLKPSSSSAGGLITQFASVKMEDTNHQELNLSSRQLLGNDHQLWNNSSNPSCAWTDLSGFSSSSTTSHL